MLRTLEMVALGVTVAMEEPLVAMAATAGVQGGVQAAVVQEVMEGILVVAAATAGMAVMVENSRDMCAHVMGVSMKRISRWFLPCVLHCGNAFACAPADGSELNQPTLDHAAAESHEQDREGECQRLAPIQKGESGGKKKVGAPGKSGRFGWFKGEDGGNGEDAKD